MKKLIIYMNVFLLGSVFIFSQEKGKEREKSTYESSYQNKAVSGTPGMVTQSLRSKGDLKGSPYINEDFISADVDGSTYSMRYNAHEDQFEYLDNDAVVLFPAKLGATVVEIPRLNKKYEYLNYKDGRSYNYGFLVVLYETDNLKLFKKEKVNFIKGVVPKTSYDRAYPDEYRRERDVFYYQINGGEIDRVPTRNRQFTSLFADQSKEIDNYIKNNKISLNDENDLKKLFEFIGK